MPAWLTQAAATAWAWLGLPQLALIVTLALAALPAWRRRRKAERTALSAQLGDLADAFLLEVEVRLRQPDDTRNHEDLRRVQRLQRPIRKRLDHAARRRRRAVYMTLAINSLVLGLPGPLIFSGLDFVLMSLDLLAVVAMSLLFAHYQWLERQVRRELVAARQEADAIYLPPRTGSPGRSRSTSGSGSPTRKPTRTKRRTPQ